ASLAWAACTAGAAVASANASSAGAASFESRLRMGTLLLGIVDRFPMGEHGPCQRASVRAGAPHALVRRIPTPACRVYKGAHGFAMFAPRGADPATCASRRSSPTKESPRAGTPPVLHRR